MKQPGVINFKRKAGIYSSLIMNHSYGIGDKLETSILT